MSLFQLCDYYNTTIDENNEDIASCGIIGHLMSHQSKIVKTVFDYENSDYITVSIDKNYRNIYSNRLIITLAMGAGKTIIAIAIICSNPEPKLKPVYLSISSSPNTLLKKVFNKDKHLTPTFIVVHTSVFNQWIDQIKKFSKLRIYKVEKTRDVINLINVIRSDLKYFNSNYDVVVVMCKTVSGVINSILNHCSYIHGELGQKTKLLTTIVFDALKDHYFTRIIYDDWDMLSVKTIPFENASSCIYMSATCKYAKPNCECVRYITLNDKQNFVTVKSNLKTKLSNPGYSFTDNEMSDIIRINIDSNFLNNSIKLGIPDNSSIKIPAQPIVKICHVKNTDNDAINIIATLTDDSAIMESVNSLSVESPSSIIHSLLSKRFDKYKQSVCIVDKYNQSFISSLDNLPQPPEGLHFTEDDIKALNNITYKYRDIVNRITEVVKEAELIINNEEKMLERVRTRISENSCPICLEEIQTEPSAIMFCCNTIIHVSCAMRFQMKKCPACRADYKKTFAETFVCLHHTNNITEVLEEMKSDSIIKWNPIDNVDIVKITKFTILKDILLGNKSSVMQTDIDLVNFKSISFDRNSDVKCISDDIPIKALISCSSDETLRSAQNILKEFIEVSTLTKSSKLTHEKLLTFKESKKASAILTNLYKNAAGLDLSYVTHVIFLNIIEDKHIMQQLIGRVLRITQKYRPIIYLIAFDNEAVLWKKHYHRS